MASARARLGKARQSMIKRQKTTGVVTGALSAIGTVAAFGAGQVKKADTAWEEYETGYGEIPGADVADIQKPGFFKRTAQQLFPGGKTGLPEGEVRVGDTMYDRSKIQKAGSFLGSDTSAILSDEQRSQYLGRTAPGTAVSTEQLTSELRDRQEQSYKTFLSDPENVQKYGKDIYAEGAGIDDLDKSRQMLTDAGWTGGKAFTSGLKFDQTGGVGASKDLYGFGRKGTGGVQHELTGGDFQPFVAGGERGRDAAGTVEIQKQQRIRKSASSREIAQERRLHAIPGPNVNIDFQSQIKKGFKDLFTSGWTGEGGGTGVKTEGPSQIPENKYSYSEGVDFITNGPQEILVGDNPSGRERVTVKPLSSKNDAEFGRYGDDAMKMIDGQPAHIDSSIEGDMSPEDIKKYGAGTINPITGKKEYFLGAIATGLAIGSSLYKGYQATQNQGDVEAGKTAAGDIYQEQVQSAGQQKTAGLEQIKSQYTTGMEELNLGTQMQATGIQTSGEFQQSRTNLVSGSVESQMEEKKKNLMAMHATTAKKQMDTKKAAEAQELFAFQNKERSAQDLLQGTLTGLESQPGGSSNQITNFLEGMFS